MREYRVVLEPLDRPNEENKYTYVIETKVTRNKWFGLGGKQEVWEPVLSSHGRKRYYTFEGATLRIEELKKLNQPKDYLMMADTINKLIEERDQALQKVKAMKESLNSLYGPLLHDEHNDYATNNNLKEG